MDSDHAIVVGGSVAGLLAAAATAEHFDRVTIVERDQLVDAPVARKGSPQASQVHILLPIGEVAMEDILPGLRKSLVAAGCREYNYSADMAALTSVGWLPRVDTKAMEVIGYRRPLLEWVIRRRVLSVGNVEIRQAAVDGLTVDDAGSRVTGVKVTGGDVVSGDLVIDASGRGTKAPKWLARLGFRAPDVSEVRSYIGYTTQFVKVPEGLLEAGVKGLGTLPQPEQPVGGALIPADSGVCAAVAYGMMKHYPPADREGMIEFLSGAPSPIMAEILRETEPVSEAHSYRMPGNLRRRWEDLEDLPGRLGFIGDAVASLNPIYGQGLTVAAFGASILRESLANAGTNLDAGLKEFQRLLGEKADIAFDISARGDVSYEGVELENYRAPDEGESHRMGRLWELAAQGDVEVLEALTEANFGMRAEALQVDQIQRKSETSAAAENPPIDPRDYPKVVLPEGSWREKSGR